MIIIIKEDIQLMILIIKEGIVIHSLFQPSIGLSHSQHIINDSNYYEDIQLMILIIKEDFSSSSSPISLPHYEIPMLFFFFFFFENFQ